jgi:hypothetical protein
MKPSGTLRGMRQAVFFVLVVLGAGCRGLLAGTTFSKDAVAYRVVTPNDGKGWRRVDFADNDLAWLANESGHVVAINATCSDHEDPQLDVLTKHLVMGFTDREWLSQTPFTLDGRAALRSKVRARLDGVPMSLELVVMKKNGCVHDFEYISPVGHEAEHQAAFDALVNGFKQERRGE